MAKKVIRLTENDIYQLVKKVLKEQVEDDKVTIENASRQEVEDFIGKLPNGAKSMAILNSEYADFTGFDVCITGLNLIFLKGTPNNLEEQNFDCVRKISNDMFQLKK